jgi:hypothetical protein
MMFLLMWKSNQKITIIKTHILVMNRMSFNYFSRALRKISHLFFIKREGSLAGRDTDQTWQHTT